MPFVNYLWPPGQVALPVAKLIPKNAPQALQGEWNLLPQKLLGDFVLAPLPNEITNLALEFHELDA